jgi:hypothetical protein
MTRLASVALMAFIAGSTTRAEEPKPIPTELEGTWREPVKPGEKAADKLVVTFSNDEITVVWDGAVFRGTVDLDAERHPAFVRFLIIRIDAKGKEHQVPHKGLCLRKDDQLFLQVIPHPPDPKVFEANQTRGPAPVTFTLEKLKK